MGTQRTGITAAGVAKYLRGGGQLRRDFTDMDNLGTALGETKGGTSFSYGLRFHDVEPDGGMGLVIGHRFIDWIVPTLSVNLLEHSVDEYLRHLPAADSADQCPTGIKGEYIGVGTEVDVGVAPAGSDDIDESTLEVWRTPAALGSGVKLTLDTDYNVVDQITLASVANGDTIVIGGVTFTGHTDTTTPADREFAIDGTDTADAVELISLINNATYGVSGVTATSALGVVSLSRATAGTKNVITQTGDHMTMVYQVVLGLAAGAILDGDFITVFYVYDATASGDTFTIIKPGQIAAADHFTNIALLTEVSDVDQTYPVIFIIKNPLSVPDTIEIPGERINETVLKTTFHGFFDPSDGLNLANAPVELWVPYGI